MKGYVEAHHKVQASQKRISTALKKVSPDYQIQRNTNTARLVNPVPYKADYFGHKLHIDQNEKLVMYGVTHVAAIDGHSRFIVAASTMPVKSNRLIYDTVYRYPLIGIAYLHNNYY